MEQALLTFLGVVLGAAIGIAGTFYTTLTTVNEQKRKARADYLTSRMDILSQSLAQYEVWLSKRGDGRIPSDPHHAAEHARIIGEAIAACLAVGDLPEEGDIIDEGVTPDTLPEIPYRLSKMTHRVHRLAYIANKRLTRNFVEGTEGDPEKQEVDMWGRYDSRNRHALDHAVKRLAQLIEETN